MIDLRTAPQIALRREPLLSFLDERMPREPGFLTGFSAFWGEDLAIGLMAHYFLNLSQQSVWYSPRCTQGARSGARLDCWLLVNDDKLYQVEIKNWAAATYGSGPPVPLAIEERALARYERDRWQQLWPERFRDETGLNKVLIPMEPPEECAAMRPKPLLCLWWAIDPYGAHRPFFRKSLPRNMRGLAKTLHVFSLSSYLRSLASETVEIPFPRGHAKLEVLRGILDVGSNSH
ncbi:MAG: hypothetical protein ACOYXN_08865 [Acidobacteriota bacterium]